MGKFLINPTTSSTDWHIEKLYGGNGSVIWEINWSSPTSAADTAKGVAIDSSGNITVVGEGYNLTGASGLDWHIKKLYGGNGTSIWEYNWSSIGLQSDLLNGVAIDSSDNIIVVGVGTNLTATNSNQDMYVKKFHGNNGTLIWAYNWTSPGTWNDGAYGIDIDSSDNVVVAGGGKDLVSASSGLDWHVASLYGNNGSLNWEYNWSANGQGDDTRGVSIDSKDRVILVGYGTDLISPSSNGDWRIEKLVHRIKQCGNMDISNTVAYDIDVSNDAFFAANGVCLNITRDDIVINGGGFRLLADSSGYGVYNELHSSVTITNLTIINFSIGVYWNNASNGTILNNSITTNGSSNNYGIYLLGSDSNNVSSNVVSTYGASNNYGIFLGSGTINNTIHGNTITSSGTQGSNVGIQIQSSNNTITSNIITTNGTEDNHGIYLTAVSISGNIFSSNEITTTGNTSHGIILFGASFNNSFENDLVTVTHSTSDEVVGLIRNFPIPTTVMLPEESVATP